MQNLVYGSPGATRKFVLSLMAAMLHMSIYLLIRFILFPKTASRKVRKLLWLTQISMGLGPKCIEKNHHFFGIQEAGNNYLFFFKKSNIIKAVKAAPYAGHLGRLMVLKIRQFAY